MFKLLYKVGYNKNKESFSKLSLADKSGKENEEISKFFENHLENIFPKIRLFTFKKNGKITSRHKFERGEEFDAISWNPEEKTFIIFEYKSTEVDDRGVGQVIRYLSNIQKKESKYELVEILNDFFPKEGKGLWKVSDIKWEKLKLILITLKSSEIHLGIPSQIIWVKSEWFENNKEQVVVFESKEKRFLQQISETKEENHQPTYEKPLSLKQEPGWKKRLEKWIDEKIKPLGQRYSFAIGKSQTAYNLPPLRKEAILSICLKNPWNQLYLPNPKIYFVEPSKNLINKYSLKKGRLNWEYLIDTNANFQELFQLIEEFLKEKQSKSLLS